MQEVREDTESEMVFNMFDSTEWPRCDGKLGLSVRTLISVDLCVAEASSEDSFKYESEETPPSKWMMLTPKYRDKFKICYSRTHWMESRSYMTLRSRKHPNYRKWSVGVSETEAIFLQLCYSHYSIVLDYSIYYYTVWNKFERVSVMKYQEGYSCVSRWNRL